jgi:hypothetical protein
MLPEKTDPGMCAHCGLLPVGYAAVDGAPLCNPDSGLNCYRMVTVYHHDTPCHRDECTLSTRQRRIRDSDACRLVCVCRINTISPECELHN